jgi:hypothetical protein
MQRSATERFLALTRHTDREPPVPNYYPQFVVEDDDQELLLVEFLLPEYSVQDIIATGNTCQEFRACLDCENNGCDTRKCLLVEPEDFSCDFRRR